MMNQAGTQDRQSQMTVLEEHVRVLEARVATLTEALRVIARGLEDLPTAEPGRSPAARAARKAHELLLAADSRPGGGARPGA